MRKWLIGGAALAAVGTLAWAHPGHPPIVPPQVSFTGAKAVPFELFRDQRIFLDGTINGHQTPMMLDSAAGAIIVDAAYARQLGLPEGFKMMVQGSAGAAPAELVQGVSLTAGSLHLDHLTVVVTDMSPISKSVGRPLNVILGKDAFKAGAVTIDFPRHTISFADRSKLSPSGATKVPMHDQGMVETVPISIAGMPPVDADLDLGNPGNVLISNAYWSARPALAGLRFARSQVGGVGGMKAARVATLDRVDFAGRHYTRVPAAMNEDPQSLPRTGANVGIGLFKQFVVTFDFAGNALYVRGPEHVGELPRERAGISADRVDDHLELTYVSPDGPGAAAGLKAGDQIAAVDGRKVGADYYSQPNWAHGPAGKIVELTRADGTKVKLKLADYY
jgi:hypothetical protein